MISNVKLSNSISIAFEAIVANKSRAFLTGLGIVFGVAAVITMLAIGTGAKQEILAQSKLIGANNIIIKPKKSNAGAKSSGDEENSTSKADKGVTKFSPGLSFEDAKSIQAIVPTVTKVSPTIQVKSDIITSQNMVSGKLIGVSNDYFSIANLQVEKGNYFSDKQIETGQPVCIIGKGIEKKLFRGRSALGKHVKAKGKWLQVVGVVEEKNITEKAKEELGIRDYNNDIYLPIKSYLLRFENRSRLRIQGGQSFGGGGFVVFFGGGDDNKPKSIKTEHELDEMIVQVDEPENLTATAGFIRKLLKRRHNNNEDFEISIPQQLIQQQQKTKDIFNLVLSVIAGISLLVGGIGIMNIMMASVTERTKEIGVRRAIGATSKDVTLQFMLEAVIISLCGGILGILLGIGGATIVNKVADIQTIVTISSILLSFGVSVAVGLIFGISPAKKAADQNPIESLRYE